MIQAVPHSTSSTDWSNSDFVKDTVGRCYQQMAHEIADRFKLSAERALRRDGLESPLEAAFLAAWEMYEQLRVNGCTGDRFYLAAQVPVDAYRLDFQIKVWGDSRYKERFPKMCIELDGHAFHELTKEQVARRNERDRHLLSRGWRVIRFSGSEFYRDPFGCVWDAWRIADDAIGELFIQDWRREEGRE